MTEEHDDDFPHECQDVAHFNAHLVRWLAHTPLTATLGPSHNSIVTTVPIGGERCVLHGTTSRVGVATYLERTLGGSAPFFVVPSTKSVVHRVTVGRPPGRIHGFYLYTYREFQEPTLFAAPDGSAFGWKQVAFKLFDAVRLLHQRGHQRLHVLPMQGDLGWHFHVGLSDGITYGGGLPEWSQESTVFAWSSASGFRVGRLDVGPDTPTLSIAREILSGAADEGIGRDWAYAGWYAELLAEARRLGQLPACDAGIPGDPAWEIGRGTGNLFPSPPVLQSQQSTTQSVRAEVTPIEQAAPTWPVTVVAVPPGWEPPFTHPYS